MGFYSVAVPRPLLMVKPARMGINVLGNLILAAFYPKTVLFRFSCCSKRLRMINI